MADSVIVSKLEFYKDSITTIWKCSCKEAKYLCIYDPATKLKNFGEYDIGGCYSEDPEIWFYFTTSVCPGPNNMLNLFACKRKPGNFNIKISNTSEIQAKLLSECIKLPRIFKSLSFRSTRSDEYHYITTYVFTQEQVKALETKALLIPIQVEVNTEPAVAQDLIDLIKLEHNRKKVFHPETSDFTLISSSGKHFPVHKVVLAAHSKVLAEMLTKLDGNSLQLHQDDLNTEMLIKFLYHGTIENLIEQDTLSLIHIAKKYELDNLFELCEKTVVQQISVKNAIDIAVLSETHKMAELQVMVFQFIKDHPKILETESWKQLDNVVLVKKMFQFIYK